MNHDIEARLERSLKKQIAAPRLDRGFDAAVWSRIEAAEGRATNPVSVSRAEKLSRWLFLSNVAGGLVVVVLALYFGLRAFGGIDLGVTLTIPRIPESLVSSVITATGYVITVLVLGFVFTLTSFGRRLRAQFF